MESTQRVKGRRQLHVVPSSGSEPECGNVELLCVCDFCRKFASHGQPVRGVYQDSQICDKNHKFATGLARIYAFCDEFSEIFAQHKHKNSFGIAPLSSFSGCDFVRPMLIHESATRNCCEQFFRTGVFCGSVFDHDEK